MMIPCPVSVSSFTIVPFYILYLLFTFLPSANLSIGTNGKVGTLEK